ncbi:MAG: CPBP family intramembrane metalloprotease [Pirellulales bacterium]|nr:CPBP family intramembrane metalloprotease [Pirellulales bacterium]
MSDPSFLLPHAVAVLLWLGLWACLAFWTVVFVRRRRGEPVLPLARRRQVPWRAIDLAVVIGFHVACFAAAFALKSWTYGPEAVEPPRAQDTKNLTTQHEILQMLAQGNVGLIVLGVLSAVVVAPVVEEVLFRLLLQGWLEAVDRRLRREIPRRAARRIRWGFVPVTLVAALFALIHFRVEKEPIRPEHLVFDAATMVIVPTVVAALAVAWVGAVRGATLRDLGIVREKLAADVGLGLAAFAGIAAPLYLGQMALLHLVPEYVSVDPITLFPFALVLGILYCRTHRIVPSIVLHVALNGSSLLLLWLL